MIINGQHILSIISNMFDSSRERTSAMVVRDMSEMCVSED